MLSAAQLRLAIGDDAWNAIPDATFAPPARAKSLPRRHPRECRSPDRQRSLERRRRLALSGPLPPGLACQFTTGELAALRIIGDEWRTHGRCTLFIDAIAARAGVSRSTVKNAIRRARELGLVSVEERRATAFRNDSNVVRVISKEWRTWLAHGRRETAVKKVAGTDNQLKRKRSFEVEFAKIGPPDVEGKCQREGFAI
jgi:DNA-binding Lrp family transcriptional regulator